MRNEERISYNTKQVSAARTYVKSCSPKNNRSNKKKTLFFFKKMASFFKNLLIFLLLPEIRHIP